MRYTTITNAIGDQVSLPFDENGVPYCPICGESMYNTYAYYDDGSPSEEICGGCGVQFGDDDLPRDASMSTDEYFDRVRLKWLDREGWKSEQVEQLQSILGIDAKELRQRFE